MGRAGRNTHESLVSARRLAGRARCGRDPGAAGGRQGAGRGAGRPRAPEPRRHRRPQRRRHPGVLGEAVPGNLQGPPVRADPVQPDLPVRHDDRLPGLRRSVPAAVREERPLLPGRRHRRLRHRGPVPRAVQRLRQLRGGDDPRPRVGARHPGARLRVGGPRRRRCPVDRHRDPGRLLRGHVGAPHRRQEEQDADPRARRPRRRHQRFDQRRRPGGPRSVGARCARERLRPHQRVPDRLRRRDEALRRVRRRPARVLRGAVHRRRGRRQRRQPPHRPDHPARHQGPRRVLGDGAHRLQADVGGDPVRRRPAERQPPADLRERTPEHQGLRGHDLLLQRLATSSPGTTRCSPRPARSTATSRWRRSSRRAGPTPCTSG